MHWFQENNVLAMMYNQKTLLKYNNRESHWINCKKYNIRESVEK